MADTAAQSADPDALSLDRPEPATATTPPFRLEARDRVHAGWVLAPDETLVWTGRPAMVPLAIQMFRLPIVAAYFGALAAWGSVEAIRGHTGAAAILMPLATGLATIGVALGIALLVARSTTYLVTTDRVILRYGAVLSRSLSIPFRQIAALSLSAGRGDRGDIALTLRTGIRIPYLKLWPHVRPWQFRHPEPMLCSVPGASLAATQLARRLQQDDVGRRTADRGAGAPSVATGGGAAAKG